MQIYEHVYAKYKDKKMYMCVKYTDKNCTLYIVLVAAAAKGAE